LKTREIDLQTMGNEQIMRSLLVPLANDGPLEQAITLHHTNKAVGVMWREPTITLPKMFGDLYHHRGLILRPTDEEYSIRV
jgi:hypothetical protein